jgi:uncharacterized RDD family membrane protein YckC
MKHLHLSLDVLPKRKMATLDKAKASTRMWFASWWSRAVALLLDSAIVVAIALCVRAILAPYILGESVLRLDESYTLRLATAMLAAALYYPVLMWWMDGRAVGKMALKIRVVSTNGRAMTLSLAATREVVIQTGVIGGLASLPGVFRVAGLACGLLDYLWPLWDFEKRALHDMIVGTRVIVVNSRRESHDC